MNNKKRQNVLIACAVISLLAIAMFFFIIKSNKEEKNNSSSKDDVRMVYYMEDKLYEEINFKFKDKRVNDIILIYYFDNEQTAKLAVDLYKDQKDYSSASQKGKKVVLHYSKDNLLKYINYTPNDLITEFESYGFINQKNNDK